MRRSSLQRRLQRGQAMAEYGVITAAFFGFTVLSWPFLIQLLRALNTYFQSIYYIIQSPIP
ncbi:hypothetical protein [Corallococcus llansteffanensis]|uniref:Uncharacterized protein n=1 Tax=Corallococcus llansteffanensis TaxID=2316731 RepID=A0A3A8NX55_9BACT|nr:hypothetical protein [Corallococcus llansteffanensis]RKH48828.1 hypothetical protein D7V93_32740 [Corallococcus llansteffanensis]